MLPWTPNWKYTELSSSHHSSMVVKPGPYTGGTWSSLKGSINVPFAPFLEYGGRTGLQTQKSLKNLFLHRSDAAEVLPLLDRPCDQDGGSPNSKATTIWRARTGSQETGPSMQTFKDTVKAGSQWYGIPPTELVATALDRQRWCTLTQSASSTLEEERRHQAQSARERRHLAVSIPATNANFQCPDCARLCKSRIGLQSHSRTHR